jgi:preprotein translocase subunit Sss1
MTTLDLIIIWIGIIGYIVSLGMAFYFAWRYE